MPNCYRVEFNPLEQTWMVQGMRGESWSECFTLGDFATEDAAKRFLATLYPVWTSMLALNELWSTLDLAEPRGRIRTALQAALQKAYDAGRLDERMKNHGQIACEQCGGTGLAE